MRLEGGHGYVGIDRAGHYVDLVAADPVKGIEYLTARLGEKQSKFCPEGFMVTTYDLQDTMTYLAVFADTWDQYVYAVNDKWVATMQQNPLPKVSRELFKNKLMSFTTWLTWDYSTIIGSAALTLLNVLQSSMSANNVFEGPWAVHGFQKSLLDSLDELGGSRKSWRHFDPRAIIGKELSSQVALWEDLVNHEQKLDGYTTILLCISEIFGDNFVRNNRHLIDADYNAMDKFCDELEDSGCFYLDYQQDRGFGGLRDYKAAGGEVYEVDGQGECLFNNRGDCLVDDGTVYETVIRRQASSSEFEDYGSCRPDEYFYEGSARSASCGSSDEAVEGSVSSCSDESEGEHPQSQLESPHQQVEYSQPQVEYPQYQREYSQQQIEYPQMQVKYPQRRLEYPQQQPEYPQKQIEYPQNQIEYLQKQIEYKSSDQANHSIDAQASDEDEEAQDPSMEEADDGDFYTGYDDHDPAYTSNLAMALDYGKSYYLSDDWAAYHDPAFHSIT